MSGEAEWIPRPTLSTVVTVRFRAEEVAAMRAAAKAAGLTLSAWLRRAVEEEVAARDTGSN